ncbi:MAG: sulfatase [Verrucomicrobiota bacterium]
MSVRSFFLSVVLGLSWNSLPAADRPNILFILADDLAWSDLGCYGHPWHQAPNLDRLAMEGMRFTDAYAPAPICSASRASILTGKTTARLQFEFVTKEKPGRQVIEGEIAMQTPPFTLNLSLAEETMAEVLKESGYDTGFVGKWHLNQHHKRYLGWSPTHGPAKHGFETTIDTFGAHPYGWKGGEVTPVEEKDVFPRDELTERAVEFLQKDHDAPFFLMASLYYVHTPIKTQCPWLIDKYEHLVPAESPNRKNRVRYGAFIEMMDHYVGQLLEALDESGLNEETMVVFTSDNGGHPEYTANSPLRGSKWNLYEGGIRVPFLVRWPGRVKPESISNELVIGYDLKSTFAEVAGVEFEEMSDGISVVPAFEGRSLPDDRALIWHFPYYHPERGYKSAINDIGMDDFAVSKTRPQSAIRKGAFKLLSFPETESVELYDLKSDMGEQWDIHKNSAAAVELAGLLRESLGEMQARMPVAKNKKLR